MASAIIIDPYANVSTPLRETIRNKHIGTTVNIQLLDFQEEFMEEKVRNFEALTGVIVEKIISTQETWYDDVLGDIQKSRGFIDLYASFGNWIPQYAELGGLKDLSDDVFAAVGFDWFDIMVR